MWPSGCHKQDPPRGPNSTLPALSLNWVEIPSLAQAWLSGNGVICQQGLLFGNF